MFKCRFTCEPVAEYRPFIWHIPMLHERPWQIRWRIGVLWSSAKGQKTSHKALFSLPCRRFYTLEDALVFSAHVNPEA